MIEARLFQALSDATRLKILSLLAREPLNVSRMVRELGYAQPAVSRHLRVLREVDLIRDKRLGKEVEYSLNHSQVSGAAAYLKRLAETVSVAPEEEAVGRGAPGGDMGGSDQKAKGRRARRPGATGIPSGAGARRKNGVGHRAETAKPGPEDGPGERPAHDEAEYAIERRDDDGVDDFLL
ncbi:MAG: metalloregulator ArsR/SmtB family transcription factor [Candidatus Eisenbacteria bacterium]